MARESVEWLNRRHRARSTGAILDDLRAEGWSVFHDVRMPARRRLNLDHVVVGPAGVFVIDSKNWSGQIEVRENNFWIRGRRQDRVVGASSEAALAVAGLLGGPAVATVRSALCFERSEPVVGWCYDVMLCSTGNLREMLIRRPQVLSPDQVTLAAIELDLGFHAAATEVAVRTPKLQPKRQPKPRQVRAEASRWFRRGLLRLGVLHAPGDPRADVRPEACRRPREHQPTGSRTGCSRSPCCPTSGTRAAMPSVRSTPTASERPPRCATSSARRRYRPSSRTSIAPAPPSTRTATGWSASATASETCRRGGQLAGSARRMRSVSRPGRRRT